MAYILSEGDHRKSGVQNWAWRHRRTLEGLVGQPVRRMEFSNDRLGIVLRRLSRTSAWEALEAELWQSTLAVYEMEMRGVRLDSTSVYGYHSPTEGGITARG